MRSFLLLLAASAVFAAPALSCPPGSPMCRSMRDNLPGYPEPFFTDLAELATQLATQNYFRSPKAMAYLGKRTGYGLPSYRLGKRDPEEALSTQRRGLSGFGGGCRFKVCQLPGKK